MNPLRKLTWRLYALSICKGLVFWYGIEKLFEAGIGLSPQQIIIVGIIAQTAIVAFEIPSSVFADRVSRKQTLIIANIAFAVCSLVLGLSSTFWMYVFGIVIWALSDALTSGVRQAFVYDSLIELKEESKYRRIISRMVGIELFVLGVVGIISSVIGAVFNLASDYFLSVIPPLLAVVLLISMREPPITRTSELGMTWIRHLHEGLKMIFKPVLVWVSVGTVLLTALITVWYEYYQLIGIEVRLPEAIFGLSIAFLTLGLIVGSAYAGRFKPTIRSLLFVWGLFWVSNVLLILIRDFRIILLIMFTASISIKALEIYFEVYIQDHIPSAQRATAVSLINTVGHLAFFFMGLAFIALANHYSVRATFLVLSIPLFAFGVLTGLRKFKDYIPQV